MIFIISSKEKVNQVDRGRIEKAIGFLAVNFKNRKLNFDTIEEVINNGSIYPDEENYLKTKDDIYFGDNEHRRKYQYRHYKAPSYTLIKTMYNSSLY